MKACSRFLEKCCGTEFGSGAVLAAQRGSSISVKSSELILRQMSGFDEGVLDNLTVSIVDMFNVFLEPPMPQNVVAMSEVLNRYTTTYAYLQRKADEGFLSEEPLGWGLHEWAANYALKPQFYDNLVNRVQSSLLVAALFLAFVVSEVFEPKLVPEESQQNRILILNYCATLSLTLSILLGLGYLDAAGKAYLHLEKFVIRIKFYMIVGIVQCLYVLGSLLTIISLSTALCAHLEIDGGFTALFSSIFTIFAMFFYLKMLTVGDSFQHDRSEIFCLTVLDEDTLFVKQDWYEALRYLVDMDDTPMGGMVPDSPRIGMPQLGLPSTASVGNPSPRTPQLYPNRGSIVTED